MTSVNMELRYGWRPLIGATTMGRFRVGAKNEKEAEQLVRDKVGKHIKCNVYYEEKNEEQFLPRGMVMNDITKEVL